MTKILFRTFFMYAVILLSMKMMGKRQLGQMQISEFITAMILSELAAMPISDKTIPLVYCLIPLILLICTEVILSYISTKSSHAQKFLEGTPAILIDKGVLDQQALIDNRITLKELLVEIRIAGLSSISQAQYVYLEPNGKFSVIPKADYRQATVGDLKLDASEDEPDISVIVDGKIIEQGLEFLNKSHKWLDKQIQPHLPDDILLFSANRAGGKTLILKEKGK